MDQWGFFKILREVEDELMYIVVGILRYYLMDFSLFVVEGFIVYVWSKYMVLILLMGLMVIEWPTNSDKMSIQVGINICNNFIECVLVLLRRREKF